MAQGRASSNAWLWGIGLGVVAGLLAAAGNGFVAYHTVVGASFDWLEWKKHADIDPEVAALSLALSTFLLVLVLASIAAATSWTLATRGKLHARVKHRHRGQPNAWEEYALGRAFGYAALSAGVAATVGFIYASIAEGEVLDGKAFFLLSIAVGAATALAAVIAIVATMARAHEARRIAQDDPRGNVIARAQVFASRNAKAVVLGVVLITLVAGIGITKITTNVDVADVLPRGNGNTTAAQNLTTNFKSTFTQQVTVQFPINVAACQADSQRNLPFRVTNVACSNITDEVYVRALEEFYQLILEDEDNPIRFNIGLPSFYKLINWTMAGGQSPTGDPAAFSLPGTQDPLQAQLYAQVNETVWAAIPDVVTPVIDPSFDQTASLYLVPTDSEATAQQIGEAMLAFRDAYVQMVDDGDTRWSVWGSDNEPMFTVDIPIANAHASELAREDFVTLFPIIFAFIIVTLYFSFRNVAAIGIAGATLLVATIWTYGLMGHMGIALNTLNLTVLPLILGVGIDFAIHQITEFANHKREGLSDEDSLRISGGFAGFAMLIATLTSSSGLLVMTVSPSLLMAQLGFLSAVAIVSVYLLTILFIPALLSLARSSEGMGKRFQPSSFMRALARSVSRGRVAAILVVALITVGTLISATNLGIEEFGEPAKNFPEDDPLRIEHERGIRGFYDLREDCTEEEEGQTPECTELKTNVIVFEGDNTDLQASHYIEAVQQEMSGKPNLTLSTSRTMPFLMRTWLTVKDGAASAGPEIIRQSLLGSPFAPVAEGADPYPQTREEIIAELDAAFASPLATFASLFADAPDYNITIMTFGTTTGDFEVAEGGWNDVWASIDAVDDQRPHDLRPAFVGNTALNYLFITEELPWLSYLGIVSAIIVTLLTIIFTKRIRTTLAVLGVMGATSIWWLGVLPMVDIGLAITLMLPAVFITSIGSDYAIHMGWNLLKNPDRDEVYSVVGKAVLYSMITTVGAFAIFTQTQNVAAAKAMVATVIAIIIMFVATVLIMPIFYPLRRAQPVDEEDEGEPSIDYIPTTRVVERGGAGGTGGPSPGPSETGRA